MARGELGKNLGYGGRFFEHGERPHDLRLVGCIGGGQHLEQLGLGGVGHRRADVRKGTRRRATYDARLIDHPPVALLFGVRTQEDILWREQLEAWAARDPRFQLAVTLSRPDQGWQGRAGYVQAHLRELSAALGEPHVFICGLSRMVSEVRAVCKGELGYDRKRIHSERYD